MQAPKKKTSKSKRNMRRSHHALTAAGVVPCSNCGEPKRRHMICPSCGYYKGKAYIVQPSEGDEA